ncbi:MAG: DUF2067 domain-containing protein [Desulfurococcaceae archaeon]
MLLDTCWFLGDNVPLVKRRIHLPCREEECFKLYELLKDKIPSLSYLRFDITEKGLLIEAYGYETDIKSLWFELKRTLGVLREAMSKSKRSRKYSVELITRTIRKTFSPAILVEVLKRKGYQAEFISEENVVVSDALFEEVLNIAEKIADYNMQASRIAKNTSTRNYIVACSALTGLSIDDVVKVSVNMGILEEENGKYVLREHWSEALDKVLKTIKRTQ